MPINPEILPEYANNPLIAACGPILEFDELLTALSYIPSFEHNIKDAESMTLHNHLSNRVRQLHIPTQFSISFTQNLDLMIRQGYIDRNPNKATSWRSIYQPDVESSLISPRLPPLSMIITGLSGLGKSTIVERALQLYIQTYLHESFPQMATPFRQLIWLKVNVPASGKSIDLAEGLMLATDEALGTELHQEYFGKRPKTRMGCHSLIYG